MTDTPARHVRLRVAAEDEGARLDQFIATRADLSRSQAQRLIHDGRVRLDRGRAKPALTVESGLVVDIDIPAPTKGTMP